MRDSNEAPSPWQIVIESVQKGFLRGVRTCFVLTRSIVPFFVLTWLAEKSGVMAKLGATVAPVMSPLGLPGAAALPLVIGFLGGITAAIGSVAALTLGIRELTIFGAMIGVCHATVIEGAIIKQVDGPAVTTGLLRFAMATVAGLILNLIL